MAKRTKIIRHPSLPPVRQLPSNRFPANSPAPAQSAGQTTTVPGAGVDNIILEDDISHLLLENDTDVYLLE